MNYSIPSINSVAKFYLLGESQYAIGLVPGDDGCPTIVFSEAAGTGSVDYEATILVNTYFENGQTCSVIIANYSGRTAFQDNVLLLDCSIQSVDCDFPQCSVDSNLVSAELCLDSLTVNGEAQNVGICIPVSLDDYLNIDSAICSEI